MHETVQNLVNIQKSIKSKLLDFKQGSRIPKIIAVSKTFKLEHIMPLIYYGHVDFGESKVQEAIDKWRDIKANNKSIKLHLIGKLQTNKVKKAYLFPLKWILVGFLGLFLDAVKAPGYVIGSIISPFTKKIN